MGGGFFNAEFYLVKIKCLAGVKWRSWNLHFRLPLWQRCESKGAQDEGSPSGISTETALGMLGQGCRVVECAAVRWSHVRGHVDQPRLSGVFTWWDLSTKCSNPAPACGGREKELRMHRSRVQYQSMLEFGVPGSVNQWPLKWSMLALLWGGLKMDIIRFYLISISSNFNN